MNYLGIDPGFAFLGLASVEKREDGQLSIIWMDVFEARAEKGAPKTKDAIRRLGKIYERLEAAIGEQNQDGSLAHAAIVAEAMSHVRNASASTKVGMTWGAIVSACRRHGQPLAHISPQLIRKHLVGVRNVPKEAVQIELEKRFGDMTPHLEHVAKGKRNHAYDALAAVVTFLEKD